MSTEDVKTETQGTKPGVEPNCRPTPADWQKALADSLIEVVMKYSDPNRKPAEQRYTSKGSPCARPWDDEWAAKVEAAEQRLERRICGARTLTEAPCELAPNHENGRCRFHGGFQLTGGREGNRNAVIHGLYSRRLRVCDASCPQWNGCPCAGADVESIPEPSRPTCPYEQTEYNTALTDALDRVSRNPNHDGLDLHVAHNLALLQVMLNRAAVSMRNAPLVDETVASTDAYHMKSSKPSAHLDAFTRISREYRHFAAMLKAPQPVEPDVNEFICHKGRMAADTDLDPDNDRLLHPDSTLDGTQQARRYMREAVKHAAAGKDVAALDSVMDAASIQPAMLDAWMDRVVGAYRPKGNVLPEAAVKKVIRYILKADPDDEPPKENALDRFVKGCRHFEDEEDDDDDDDGLSHPGALLLRPMPEVYHAPQSQMPPTEESP